MKSKLFLFILIKVFLILNLFGQKRTTGFIKTASGLEYRIIKKNTKGEKIKQSALIFINYQSKLNNDSVFDSNNTSNFSYLVGESEGLKGWDEALSLLRVGDSAVFILPPHLAYKDKKVGSKLKSATITFEVKILKQISLFLESNKTNDTIIVSDGVSKVISHKGSEVQVPADCYVTLEFTGYIKTPEGFKRVFESSYIEGKKAYFQLNGGVFIKGLDEGIATMKVGEKSTFIISPEKGYGKEKKGLIPPNSVLYYDVHLQQIYNPFKDYPLHDSLFSIKNFYLYKDTLCIPSKLDEESVMQFDMLVYTKNNKNIRKIIFDSQYKKQKSFMLFNSKIFCKEFVESLKQFNSGERGLILLNGQKCPQFYSKSGKLSDGKVYVQIENISMFKYPFFPSPKADTILLEGGLKYLAVKDEVTNSGIPFTDSCSIDILYTGYYLKNGKKNIFSTTRELNRPLTFEFGSSSIIKGLALGSAKMKKGEARILFIPYQLAYGSKGVPEAGIPPETDLIFEIEAINVYNKK